MANSDVLEEVGNNSKLMAKVEFLVPNANFYSFEDNLKFDCNLRFPV